MLANGTKPAVQVNAQQLATAQKLLLFWRKPAVRFLLLSLCCVVQSPCCATVTLRRD